MGFAGMGTAQTTRRDLGNGVTVLGETPIKKTTPPPAQAAKAYSAGAIPIAASPVTTLAPDRTPATRDVPELHGMASPVPILAPDTTLATVIIPEGTKIRVRLEQTLSSARAEVNQQVQLIVVEDVTVDDVVVIAQGANVTGSILLAEPKRRMGRSGKLDFSIERVTAIDGHMILVRYLPNKENGQSHTVRTGVITAGVAFLFWPAAPFVLLAHGADVTINKGMTYEVFTDSKYSLKNRVESISMQVKPTL